MDVEMALRLSTLAACVEDPDSITSTQMVAHKHLWFQLQGIWYAIPEVSGTGHENSAHTHMYTKHSFVWNKHFKGLKLK